MGFLVVNISCFSEAQPSVRPSIRPSVRPSVGRPAIKFCKCSEWYRGRLCRQTKRCYRVCVLLKCESIASQQNIAALYIIPRCKWGGLRNEKRDLQVGIDSEMLAGHFEMQAKHSWT